VSRYQKKHSPIPTCHGHQSSLICFLPVQFTLSQSFSTISLQVFFGLLLGLVPSTSNSMHFFTQSLSSFHSTCPDHHNLFCCSTNIVSSDPSLSQPFIWNSILYLNAICPSNHSHLCPLKCQPHFPFLWARSHFHATYYFAHNCCTISLSLSMIYPYW